MCVLTRTSAFPNILCMVLYFPGICEIPFTVSHEILLSIDKLVFVVITPQKPGSESFPWSPCRVWAHFLPLAHISASRWHLLSRLHHYLPFPLLVVLCRVRIWLLVEVSVPQYIQRQFVPISYSLFTGRNFGTQNWINLNLWFLK